MIQERPVPWITLFVDGSIPSGDDTWDIRMMLACKLIPCGQGGNANELSVAGLKPALNYEDSDVDSET